MVRKKGECTILGNDKKFKLIDMQSNSSDFEYKLAAFDFDYTIINANSCNYLNKLVIEYEAAKNPNSKSHTPSIATLNKYKYSDEIEQLLNRNDMTIRQNAIFKYMHSNLNIDKEAMEKCLSGILIGESMKELFYYLVNNNFELIIVSDSNTFLIETILRQNNLVSLFEPLESKILANRGKFDGSGCLNVIPLNREFNYHGVIFSCKNSTFCRNNMCKGAVIENYLQKKKETKQKSILLYIGDGKIDFCPATKLGLDDRVFVKNNSSLSKFLEEDESKNKIKSTIIYWKNATDIINHLKSKIS